MRIFIMKRLLLICIVGLGLFALAGLHPAHVGAAPLPQASCTLPATVTTADQLYNCITAANSNGAGLDTITLGANIDLTTLTTSPLPQITSEITLEGAGYAVDGGNSVQLFYVASTGNFTVNQATLQNGIATEGGAIYNHSGTLTVTNSTFTGNHATDSTWEGGGAIYNFTDGLATVSDSTFDNNSAINGGAIYNAYFRTTLIVTNSTFSNNAATDIGGAIHTGPDDTTLIVSNSTFTNNSATDGGAISHNGDNNTNATTINSSTFSGNSASRSGGAIYKSFGMVTVTNSTFSGNSAPNTGGIYVGRGDGALTVTNSTFSGNSGGSIYDWTPYLAGNIFAAGTAGDNCTIITAINDNGYNLSDDATCTNGGTGSMHNANLNLNSLADNGGLTQTHLPGAGSDAIGAIPNGVTINNNGASWTCNDANTFTDQRGQPRPSNSGDFCTAGAVELSTPPICPAWTATTADELYHCIRMANANGSSLDTITLGADINLTDLTNSSLPQIQTAITLEGAGHTIDGDNSMQLFYVTSTGNFIVNQATLQNGAATNGGAIYNDAGTVTVSNSTVAGNSATGDGGAIYNYEGGTVTVSNSTFADNSATGDGGAIYGETHDITLVVSNSTFTNNSATRGGAIAEGAENTTAVTTISSSTFSGNTASSVGGAIYAYQERLTVTNSTFSGNSATNFGGAIYGGGLRTTLTNNTFYSNAATEGGAVFSARHRAGNIFAASLSGGNCDTVSIITDNGYNLSDDATCTNGGTGSVTNATLNLGDLADNGGPTQTHMPLAGSDAIGAIPYGATINNNGISWTCNEADTFTGQRGEHRPSSGGAACTAGAIEAGTALICPSWTVTTADELSGCIGVANVNGSTLDTITLGANINLSDLTATELTSVSAEILLEGAGYTIDANNLMRHFFVTATGDFTINQTTLQNGSAASGGSIHNRGNVKLFSSTMINNTATDEGGGIYNALTTSNVTVRNSNLTNNTAATGGAISTRGTTKVSNSTLSANVASSSGGAIYTRAPLRITSSTFAGNAAPTGEAIHIFNNTSNFVGNIFAGGGGGGDNCAGSGALVDSGYNVSDDATCTNGGSGSITNATLNLGSLADNGGTTLTHLPGTGSDAIGAVPYGLVFNNGGDLLACNSSSTDQIGHVRPLTPGFACTSGAVETSHTSLTIIKDAQPSIGADFDFIIASEPLLSYSGSTTTAPFWKRPDAAGAICTISIHFVRHHVQPFMVDTNGTYTIDSVQSYNGYIYLYQDSFSSSDQCNNYLNGNDDGLAANQSTLSHELEAGRVYYLVTSGLDDADAGTFTNTITRQGGGGNAYVLYDSFTLDDAAPDDGDGVSSTVTYDVEPGTYSITELLSNNAWRLSNATCTGAGGTVSLTDETLSVEISNGEAVQCTFVNETLCPASWTVTTADELSACITLANGNESPSPTADTITLGADITLSTAPPQITSEITLEGANHFIDGGNSVQLFYVNSGGDFTVNNATLQNGYSATFGGGIFNTNGTLTVTNSTFSGNTADNGGGGIYNLQGMATVTNSTISGNTASFGGGIVTDDGIMTVTNSTISGNTADDGGGIYNLSGTLIVTNSTLSGNSNTGYGGGIRNYGTLTVNNSTFSGNTADNGGGIYNYGTVHLAGSIFARGASGNNCVNDAGTFTDNGYNLSDDASCGFSGTGSANNATLALDALADNGGPTQTHLPSAGSDAIGAIPNGTTISNNGASWTCDQSATDQRGELRPINSGDACTAGAVEVDPPAQNVAPVAVDDSAATNENTPVNIAVLTNDTDTDGDSLTVASITQPTNGSVAIEVDNTVTYTPTTGYTGNDSFTYTISDGNGGNATATVTVTVNAGNNNPVAADDSATTNENTPVNIAVLTNDTDTDGDSLTVASVTQPTNGSTAIEVDNTVTYTPTTGYTGNDSFTYTISDGNGGNATATVTVTVNAVNNNPVAADDSATTNENTPVNITVLANDSDADGDTLTVESVTQPTNGSVAIEVDNTVTYTPTTGYTGNDSFTYTISDGNGGNATATVTVTVNAGNNAPVAVDDSAVTNEDTPVNVDVLANDSDVDGDTLTVDSVTQPTNGGTAIEVGGMVTYTPTTGFSGSDSFTYTVSDGNGGSDTATVTITVNNVNFLPLIVNDLAQTNEDSNVTVDVLANDSDPDGDALQIESVTAPTNGNAAIVNNMVVYTPTPNFNGVDSFTYTANDGNGGADTATVDITVTAVNDAPVATDDSATTDEDTLVTIDVLANDSDVDGDTLTVESVTDPANGSVMNNGTDVTYTPTTGFSGSDSFTYTVSDGNGGSATATVTITVNGAATLFASCGGYDVFETAPGVYEAPGFAGALHVGTDGYDWLIGTDGPDLMLGLGGPDDIWGKKGNDVICGGDGVDIILGLRGDDTIYGDDQPDWLIGGPGNDTLYGGNGWDDLEGNGGQDTLYGEDGWDVLLGGAADDELYGGDDPDALYGQSGNDDLDGGAADDYCKGGRGRDTITNCEGASSADMTDDLTDDEAEVDEEAARRSNDGANSEHAIEQRLQQVFLPLITR